MGIVIFIRPGCLHQQGDTQQQAQHRENDRASHELNSVNIVVDCVFAGLFRRVNYTIFNMFRQL
jgi:hypothetical protein